MFEIGSSSAKKRRRFLFQSEWKIAKDSTSPPLLMNSIDFPLYGRQLIQNNWCIARTTGIPIGGKTGRRGSRPFLSPDAPPAATLMAALQTHRDSLSPDSAAEEALSGASGLLGSTSKLRGRRDSRPHLSPDGECGGDGTSPRGSRIRRQSTTTEDIFKWVFSFFIFFFYCPIPLFLLFVPPYRTRLLLFFYLGFQCRTNDDAISSRVTQQSVLSLGQLMSAQNCVFFVTLINFHPRLFVLLLPFSSKDRAAAHFAQRCLNRSIPTPPPPLSSLMYFLRFRWRTIDGGRKKVDVRGEEMIGFQSKSQCAPSLWGRSSKESIPTYSGARPQLFFTRRATCGREMARLGWQLAIDGLNVDCIPSNDTIVQNKRETVEKKPKE